ncbi:hypothetical protein C8J57DRAFT_1312166, partial [Mycena rebaudengoi]
MCGRGHGGRRNGRRGSGRRRRVELGNNNSVGPNTTSNISVETGSVHGSNSASGSRNTNGHDSNSNSANANNSSSVSAIAHIPWPVFARPDGTIHVEDITAQNVRDFYTPSRWVRTTAGEIDVILKNAARRFHSDRFNVRRAVVTRGSARWSLRRR